MMRVDVVPLNGEVNEAEAEPGAAAFEGAPQLTKAAMRAKVPHFLPHARGHVQRAAAETGTRAMNDVASRALALPPCTFACTAPERKRKLLLFCDHLRSVRAWSDISDTTQYGCHDSGWCEANPMSAFSNDLPASTESPARFSPMPDARPGSGFDTWTSGDPGRADGT